MKRIEFSQEDQDVLYEESRNHKHAQVRIRMLALYLKSLGYKHKDICLICRISRTALNDYLDRYIAGGIEALKYHNYDGRPSSLDEHKDKIIEDFDKVPPQTINEAVSRIEQLTGIKRSPSAVRDWMCKQGMKYLKAGHIPGKKGGNPEQKAKERANFVENDLEPRLQEAKEGKRAVFFVDAAHFVFGNYVSYLWCFVRIFFPSANGRKRYNVLGAIDAVSKQIITYTNTGYINAHSVIELLSRIKASVVDDRKITLVLDNARYQRCYLVQNKAKEMGIELLFLPSYSPQLNLIERFWKFTKKHCLYAKYYECFEDFKQAIQLFIDSANQKYKEQLDSLLSWNFQTFENVRIHAV